MKRSFVLLICWISAVLVLSAAAVIGYQDWQLRATVPSAPATGFFRTWADNAGQYFRCLTPSGASCYWASAHGFGANFDGNGAPLTTGLVVFYTIPFACTVSAWNVTVDAGTITIDVWRLSTGAHNIPNSSNTITGSATPSIATNTAVHSTTLTGWSPIITQNDILGFNINAVSLATRASLVLQCQ